MADVFLHLEGGNCDGKTFDIVGGFTPGPTWTCGGTTYDVFELTDGSYLGLAPGHAPLDPAQVAGPAPPPPPQIDQGLRASWHALMHAVGHTAPTRLNSTKRARAKIRSAGRR